MVALLTSVTLFQLKVEWIFDLKSIFLNSTETSVEGMVVKFLSHPATLPPRFGSISSIGWTLTPLFLAERLFGE